MRIAQVAPLTRARPRHGYGGAQRVVSYLTEELVRAGHDVTPFASGDSETSARPAGAGAAVRRVLGDAPGLHLLAGALPPFLERVDPVGLRVGCGAVDLQIERYGDDAGVNATRRQGDVEVVIVIVK